MARPLRPIVPGGFYHVVTRGNNRMLIFLSEDDRRFFLHLLATVTRRYRWRVHAYCLMGNHYHLVIETRMPNLDLGMRDLNGGFARGFNQLYDRQDHVFGKRYWSEPIEIGRAHV